GGVGDVLAMGTLRDHAFMGLQCLSSFAVAALARWLVPASWAAVAFSLSIALSAAFGGAHVAQYGGFDGPWFYGSYTVPPIFIALLVPLHHRLLATVGAAVAFTLVYWLRRPELFDYPMAHVPLVYLATISAIAAGLGQWVYRLEVTAFSDLERLQDVAQRLEHRLRAGDGEGRGLRAELARQLHDDVAQLITGARFHLDGLVRREGRADQVDRLASLLDELSGRAHVMLDQLRAPPSRGPLRDELANVRTDFQALGLTVDLLLDDGWIATAPVDEGGVVLAVVREALTNAVRHGKASEATVSLQVGAQDVSLLVVDNGGGRAASVKDGYGLVGMRERVGTLGGEVAVGDAEAGLALKARWPRRAAP
ncbi:MAG: hypothetical protein IT185_12245, partial [Acidobacteria bacterium]|nr:hypothetical protein [Acidobacteriota bacterium]